ncbi:hypothetical protein JOE11_005287 [Robbsia andropogonis]
MTRVSNSIRISFSVDMKKFVMYLSSLEFEKFTNKMSAYVRQILLLNCKKINKMVTQKIYDVIGICFSPANLALSLTIAEQAYLI